MSERDLRRLLNDVIRDIDEGRIQVRRGRLSRFRAALGGGAIAASLALSGVGCDIAQPAYGVPPTDAVAQHDAGVDAGPVVEYGGPDIDAALDAGPVVDYGGPDIDGGAMPEYGSP